MERLSIDDLDALARSFSFVALLPDEPSAARWSRPWRRSAAAPRARTALVDLPYRLFAARAVVGTRVAARRRAAGRVSDGLVLPLAFIGGVFDTLGNRLGLARGSSSVLFFVALLYWVIPLGAERDDGDHLAGWWPPVAAT